VLRYAAEVEQVQSSDNSDFLTINANSKKSIKFFSTPEENDELLHGVQKDTLYQQFSESLLPSQLIDI